MPREKQPHPITERLAAAVAAGEPEEAPNRVKEALEELCADGALELPEGFRRPLPDTYARRLLYRDPELAFTAVAMAWGPGQGTLLHDHAGIWCVECVIEREILVERYELLEEADGGLCRFVPRGSVRAAVGAAGALIPPLEYHVMRNPRAEGTCVTLHVYGGELDHCSVFVPDHDDLYRREPRQLSYTD